MAATTEIQIRIYDAQRQEWRTFTVPTARYTPRCGNNLHQCAPLQLRCACGEIRVPSSRSGSDAD